ncbi:hypothetical protein H8356DRAFT_1341640 [Neocallimastix lanati (nom. inval.)]|nr:hypothetical protein H8356DRAFT_1341640 [Neocallimastix sp. JGI-2020a]
MEILKYESLHNHFEKEFDTSISIAKHKILKMKLEKVQLNINKQQPPFVTKFVDNGRPKNDIFEL